LKATTLQAAIEKPEPVMLPEEDLHLIPLAITKHEKAAREGIELKSDLHKGSQTIDRFTEIGATACQKHAVDVG
jgi:hypothetical protein